MIKIPDIYKYKVQSCPECGGKDISLAIDTVIGYWYAFCEGCGHKGKENPIEKVQPSTEKDDMIDDNRECPRCDSREIVETMKKEVLINESWSSEYSVEFKYYLCEECDLLFPERVHSSSESAT